MNFDPRDFDDRTPGAPVGENRGVPDTRDRDGNSSQPDRYRDRDQSVPTLNRGPGREGKTSGEHGGPRPHDPRWFDRDREHRDRDRDRQDTFADHVRLPRGLERELVRDRDREYTLRGSESRTLATVGAFRVVSSRDLYDHRDRAADPRSGDLRHLREHGLVDTVRVPGRREHAVVLTKDGRELLERHRDEGHDRQQTFHSGLVRARELEHDLKVYRAYERTEARLAERGARVERVVLDHELKSEYQRWLHERDKNQDDYDGHPDRSADEIREWALDHDLPYFDGQVHFPDVRIEYQEPDGRWGHEDVEVMTPHYRGAHGASVARSGFSTYRGGSLVVGGQNRGGGSGRDEDLAEELWR